MKWLEIAVDIPAEGLEMVSLIFEELGSGGVVIDDPAIIYSKMQSGEWDICEYPDVQPQQKAPVVKGYFPLDENSSFLIGDLENRIGRLGYQPKIFTREVKEEDWATAWKAYYKPFKVGKKFLVKPNWEELDNSSDRLLLDMDPGMAFGCGTHPTTSMCMELIEDYVCGDEEVCDVGTGSSILAIAAAKLGANHVVAVDLDKTAVKVARSNVQLNNVEDKVQVLHGDLLSQYNGQADVVIANIVADVIIKLAPDAAKVLKPGGYFITSGIIDHREEEVISLLKQQGFDLVKRRTNGDWRALVLTIKN
ncbi:MAG: 50S ribosomal protein L11 methyltransferase [Firmicutes bacterium]|nr:50S ribosomal protein L11 methyltransferase [Bacillota bacterium]